MVLMQPRIRNNGVRGQELEIQGQRVNSLRFIFAA